MFRKKMFMTAICVSAVTLTGCSTATTMMNSMGDLVNGVTDVAKSAFLRGPSKKSDVSFAKAATPTTDGSLKTEVGAYVPTESYTATTTGTTETYNDEYVEIYTDNSAVSSDFVVDTSPHPCPEGTYLTADNTCMTLETDNYDFPDLTTSDIQATQTVDSTTVPCPEGTYLNAENACMYLETEEYDFGAELSTNVNPVIDTSSVPCPEGTYLTADNSCMESQQFGLAGDVPADSQVVIFAPQAATSIETVTTPAQSVATPLNSFASNTSADCPPGFVQNANNSCMFLGEDASTNSGN